MGNKPASPSSTGFRLGIPGKAGLILLVTLIFILTANSFLALRTQEQDILEETHRRGQESTHFIAQYLAYSVVSYDYHTLQLILDDLIHGHDIIQARVENSRGTIMARAGAVTTPDNARDYNEEIRLNGDLLGKITLSFSTERITHTIAERRRDTLLSQILVVVAVMLAGFGALSLLVLRPLTLISRVINRNLADDAARLEHVPIETNDEIGDVARGFNALQQRLDNARQQLESRVNLANCELQGAYDRLSAQAEELREVNRELGQLSITDPLTGLFNRRYFDNLMNSEIAPAVNNDETISLLLIDIDHLREINEQFGRGAGDAVLRNVGQMLASRIRLTDVACRYAGDEFVVLCRRATIANAVALADDIMASMATQPIRVGDQDLHITLSIGIATIPGVHRVSSAETFFRCAEQALEHSKHNGCNGMTHYAMIERFSRPAMVS
jgi:diguanylate cyclase (GGDEF)-like protein